MSKLTQLRDAISEGKKPSAEKLQAALEKAQGSLSNAITTARAQVQRVLVMYQGDDTSDAMQSLGKDAKKALDSFTKAYAALTKAQEDLRDAFNQAAK